MGTGWEEIWQQLGRYRKLIAWLTVAAVGVEYLMLGWQPRFWQLALCTLFMVPEAVLDGIYMRLYHRLSLALGAAAMGSGLLLAWFSAGDAGTMNLGTWELFMEAVIHMAAGALVLGGLLLLLFLVSGKLGFGDACYGTALGMMLGPDNALAAFFLTFWLGLAWCAGICLARLLGYGQESQAVPLGPFMAAASIISMIYGKELVAWYLGGL